MALEHEYALLGGFNRSHLGRWLGVFSAAVSSVMVFLVLAAVDLARLLGVSVNLPPMALTLVGAGTVYAAVYWLFDTQVWKVPFVGALLKVPNLAGKWSCEGEGLDQKPHVKWSGTLTIVQSWDRIRVHLVTTQSESHSVAAALLYDAAAGYRLMYHYRNAPKVGEDALAPHHGFAELVFAPGERAASGEYFNGRGRNTFGRMRLTRSTVAKAG